MNGILKRIIFISALSIIGITSINTANASAQASLQGSGSGLQNQTQQTQQQSGSNLNQTGAVQQNSTGNALNDGGTRPLGVVSNPSQSTPDATVQPSSTLTADVTPQSNDTNPLLYVAIASAVIVVIGVYALQRNSKPANAAIEAEPVPEVKPEPVKIPKKTRAPRKNKKKKSKK